MVRGTMINSSENSIVEQSFSRTDPLEVWELYLEKWYNIHTGYVLTDVKVLSYTANSSATMPSNWDLA